MQRDRDIHSPWSCPPSAGNFLEQPRCSLCLSFPLCAGKCADFNVSQRQRAVVTYHIQILPNGDHINSIAALSDPAVMSLPV